MSMQQADVETSLAEISDAIKEKFPYGKEGYDQFYRKICEEIAEKVKVIDDSEAELKRMNSDKEYKGQDAAQASQAYGILNSQLEHKKRNLQPFMEIKLLLEKGDYSCFCAKCRQLISLPRLLIVPETRVCQECLPKRR